MAWTWAVASCRGTSHVRDASECQDVSRCTSVNEALVAVVSDGAGSASFGRQGALITCRTISEHARTHFNISAELPCDDDAWLWIDEARERINRAALSRSIARREFSCTLVAVLATEVSTMILHIGDGAAVARSGGRWSAASWPAHGEYASQTYFITDDPAPQLRITRLETLADAFAVFSDGIERLVLDFGNRTAPPAFFDSMLRPFAASPIVGGDLKLSASLKRYLNVEGINERTDDDKSLILAIRR